MGAAVNCASIPPPAVSAQVFDPASTFLFVGKRQSVEALTDRLDPGEAQHAALKAAQPVRRRSTSDRASPASPWSPRCGPNDRQAVASGNLFSRYSIVKPGRKMCSRKPLNSAGMVPCQSGKRNTQCSAHRMSSRGCASAGGNSPVSKSDLRAQIGKIELRHLDVSHLRAPLQSRLRRRRQPSRAAGDGRPDPDGPG